MADLPRQLVPLPTGVSVEAEIVKPSRLPSAGNKLAVCLHPWSWLGGCMDDASGFFLTRDITMVSLNQSVFDVLSAPLLKRQYHILKFNSRGVGKSTGWPSFSGSSEAKDLQEVVQWSLRTVPDIRELVIIGYSHGSLIASTHPLLPIRTSHILLSYPLGPRALLTAFHTRTYTLALESLLKNTESNVLVIYGDVDEFTGKEKYRLWVNELEELQGAGIDRGEESVQERGARLAIARIEGATHFWRGSSGSVLRKHVEEWLP